MLSIVKHTTFNNKLKKNWQDLEKSYLLSPFHSYVWLQHYSQTILKDEDVKLNIIVIKYNEEITDILPFCIRTNKFIKILEWIGDFNTDYMGPIFNERTIFKNNKFSFKFIWREILNNIPKIDLISLKNIQEFINNDKNFFLNNFNKTSLTVCYQANFYVNWKNYKNLNIKKKIINDNLRQKKRLSKYGQLSFYLPINAKDKYSITRIMIEQKHRRYLKNGQSMFEKDKFKQLYLNCNENLENSNKVHISALKIDNEIIATHWGFYSKNIFYYIMPTYDLTKWQKYSPGNILLEYLMEWACNNNIKIFDFTDGYAKYKSNWSNKKTYVHNIEISKSYKGYVFIFFFKIRNYLIKFYIIKKIYLWFKSFL